MDKNNYISWQDITSRLHTLEPASGGYTSAQRGIITLENSRRSFVKIGQDSKTDNWARKEIAVYDYLSREHFSHIPNMLSVNDNNSAFALESLESTDGWDWSDNWTEKRLDATLAAMDALAELRPSGTDKTYFEKSFISETADGWRPLAGDSELQDKLCTKLVAAGHDDMAASLDFADAACRSAIFTFRRTELVHNDMRADNCAWNCSTEQVKIVDWNWAQLGDRRIDTNAFLVQVSKSGFDIQKYERRLDRKALHWLAGLWLRSSIAPLHPGSSEQVGCVSFNLPLAWLHMSS